MINRNISIGFIVLVLVAGLYFTFYSSEKSPFGGACTMEAMLCPDGSAVGRTGANCEFAKCPNTEAGSTGTVIGRITLSPICPVERVPPDPGCAPKPYKASLDILSSQGFKKTIQSNENGDFTVTLAAGNYILSVLTPAVLPRCEEKTVTITANSTVIIYISCDTGIR